ncbi:PstS family phosphate ABC transporter substrate-binding protein, partial [Steroidobacter sp.]|uniref:PstS family phosphate ABC transporter substrate-binding protein n=1 Tax=Steroidobacter sp. TaxID=1978227 RepID=UPI001A3C2836
ATGSDQAAHKSAAYAILVHKDNPLSKLSMQQLDGIFGAQRTGGWNALVWNTQASRGSDQNLRTWGQLGLKGAWAKQPIHVYGPPLLGAGAITEFQRQVLDGGAMWNEDLREYADRKQMVADLGNDKYGIAYTALSYRTDAVKPLAIAPSGSTSAVALNRANVSDRSYPLARPVYLYFTIDNARGELAEPRVTPLVEEFVRYVLSAQGQQAVANEGSYLPLTPALAEKQLNKLLSRELPPERKKRT